MPRFAPPIPALIVLTAMLAGWPRTGRSADDPPPPAEAIRFFEGQVRPVLVDSCYKCHGPEKHKGGLRLDSRAAILEGGDTGPAVVPGKPEESLLVAALMHGDDGPKMPPSKKLPGNQIEALKQWVQLGAPWPAEAKPAVGAAAPTSTTRKGEFRITDQDRAHWAFRPIRRPDVPRVKSASTPGNPIDAFIRANLEAKGMEPNPPASRHELIRRATFDLTGLPPTPQEVEAFLNDPAPDAYEKLVDRLLASPRYGEKWGRHWLDLVRFAETNSYERDNPKPNAWRYRDYVIKSLNADKPYDRFVREQIAGDEIPGRTNDSIAATAYYRLGIWDDEPSDREQALFDGFDDMVATTGQVFMGLTIDCARCHDHKLDPIPQKDYYRLLSFFRNITPFRNGGPTDEAAIIEPGTEAEVAERNRQAEAHRKRLQAEVDAIEDEFRSKTAAVASRPDIEDLHYRFFRDTWDVLPTFDAIKPESRGDLTSGLFDLSPRTRDDAIGFVFEGTLVVPKSGQYTFELDSDDGSRLTVGGLTLTYDGIHGEGHPKSASVELPEGRMPIRLDYFQKGHGLGLTVAWTGPDFKHRMLSATSPEPSSEKKPVELAAQIRKNGGRVLGETRFDQYRELRRELIQIKNQMAAKEAALCVTEADSSAPDTFVLVRGNAHVNGDRVEPAFLDVLGGKVAEIPTPPPGAKTSGRRTILADWLTAPDNPLTARVMANRVFQHHFGRGIVRSPNNFGLQGDRPTHPELLDWLASELMAQGWRLKPLHKAIMTSDAYKMSSRSNPEALAKDPTNDLLWRFDMRRLTAEEIRDSILAVTGMLNLQMYGPGVYPEIPAEVMAGQSVPGAGWRKPSPEFEGRRSVYIHVKRSLIVPILEGFDVAETDRSSPVRFSTTQPTQALAMINGAFLNKQARLLADRLKREAGDDLTAQVKLAFQLTTGREPSDSERKRALDLMAALRSRDGADPEDARRAFCLVALNLNEFLYLD